MNNIRRNMSRGLHAARSYRSTTLSHVPARVKNRDQPRFTGGEMIAWTCLSTSFLYWIDFRGVRTAYNESIALDKEYERASEEFEANHLASEARMKAYEEERARRIKADNVPHGATY